MEDVRSRKVAFLAYCILDQNARADGLAEHPGPVSGIVEALVREGVGMVQMPCPEALYTGLNRPPHSKSWYDTEEFQAVCEKSAKQIAKLMEKYVKNSYHIMGIIGVEHSPSCAVEELQGNKVKGGETPKRGLFMKELFEELVCRSLDNIPLIGVLLTKDGIKATIKNIERVLRQTNT